MEAKKVLRNMSGGIGTAESIRIDHGNHCLDDDELTEELIRRKIPLTVCPLSNLRLKVINRMEEHPLRRMMERGF